MLTAHVSNKFKRNIYFVHFSFNLSHCIGELFGRSGEISPAPGALWKKSGGEGGCEEVST